MNHPTSPTWVLINLIVIGARCSRTRWRVPLNAQLPIPNRWWCNPLKERLRARWKTIKNGLRSRADMGIEGEEVYRLAPLKVGPLLVDGFRLMVAAG